MLVIAGDWKTAGHRLRKPAQGTAPAIGRRHSPCNRTQAQPLQSDGRHAPQQSDARHDPPAIRHKVCPLQSDTRHGPHCRMQTTTLHSLATCSSKRKCTPLDASLVACLGITLPSLRREGLGGGSLGWFSGGGPPNAKRVPAAHGLGNPRLLKGGGYLLARIALQYHRRTWA